MTIAEHVAAIRAMINQFAEDEAPYSDELLYHLFKAAANTLVIRKREKNNTIPVWDMRYYCVGTEKGTAHDCDCIGAGCDVLKTIYEIPKPVQGKYRPYIKIMTLDHQEIPYVDISAVKALSFDPMRKGKIHYSFLNKRVVLWGTDLKRPKAILIGGYFEDVTDWATKSICDNNGNPTSQNCYSIYEDDFPIDMDLIDSAYQMVAAKLSMTLQIPSDRINETS